MTGEHGRQHDAEIRTINRFLLQLSCGHAVTADVEGWYPVSVSCCDRLGGTINHAGSYVPYASNVDYVDLLSSRAATAPRMWLDVVARRPRSDQPCPASCRWHTHSAGRYPARVGATWDFTARTETDNHPARPA